MSFSSWRSIADGLEDPLAFNPELTLSGEWSTQASLLGEMGKN